MNTLAETHISIWRSRPFVILFSSAFFVAFGGQIYNLATAAGLRVNPILPDDGLDAGGGVFTQSAAGAVYWGLG